MNMSEFYDTGSNVRIDETMEMGAVDAGFDKILLCRIDGNAKSRSIRVFVGNSMVNTKAARICSKLECIIEEKMSSNGKFDYTYDQAMSMTKEAITTRFNLDKYN